MHTKRKDWNVGDIVRQLRSIHQQIISPHNDGFWAFACKEDLFQLKCLVDDLYLDTPNFIGEEEWHEQRTLNLLKRKS